LGEIAQICIKRDCNKKT